MRVMLSDRRDVGIEVRKRMLTLVLVAAGIMALRCALDAVHGLLQ